MNSDEYRSITSRPNAFRRGDLVATAAAVRSVALKDCIHEILSQEPVAKPAAHTGTPTTDFLLITLSSSVVREIAEELLNAEADAVSPEGETTAAAASYADLLNLWSRYLESLD